MLFMGMCLCLMVCSAQAQNSFTIMAMGDSVTARGGSPESSYRYWLYTYLTNAGFNPYFVGRTSGKSGASDGPPANLWPGDAYEGGSTTSGSLPTADAWTTATGVSDASGAASRLGGGPTFLLLNLGANDVAATEFGETPLKANLLQVQTNLETIIQTFSGANSSTVILLAVPTPWVAADTTAKQFMARIGSAVSKAAHDQKKAGVDVRVVSLRGGFNPRIGVDTKDGTHPSVKGEQVIARKFFNALRPVLKKMQKQGLLG